MTQQEIFDTVLAHLRKQGRASVNNVDYMELCLYRGPGGTACAVGCLIPDELYDPLIENASSIQIMGGHMPYGRECDAPKLLPIMARISKHLGVENGPLLSELQTAHDSYLAGYGLPAWEDRMRSIALDFSLEYKPAEGDQT